MTTYPSDIPEAAVEAAKYAYLNEFNYDENAEYIARIILEAAAPHMRSVKYGPELTRHEYVRAKQAEAWDQAIEAHKAWTWDDENMDPLANPYRPTE